MRRVFIVLLTIIALFVIGLVIGIPWTALAFFWWIFFVIMVMVKNPLAERLANYMLRYPVGVLLLLTVPGREPADKQAFTVNDASLQEFVRLLKQYSVFTSNHLDNPVFVEAMKRLGPGITVNSMDDEHFRLTAVFAYAVMTVHPAADIGETTIEEYMSATPITYQIWMSKELRLMGVRRTDQ